MDIDIGLYIQMSDTNTLVSLCIVFSNRNDILVYRIYVVH